MGRTHGILIPHLDAVREAYLAGESLRTIAERYGVTVSAVGYQARVMNLPKRQRSSGDLPQSAIVQAYLNGMSAPEISKKLGFGYHNLVVRVLRSRGVELRGKGITDRAQIARIVRMFRKGMFCREIAKIEGLSTRQVGYRVRKALPGGSYLDGTRRRWARAKAGAA